jgi:hypothetical protein
MTVTPTLPHTTIAINAHGLNNTIHGASEGDCPPSVLQPRQLFNGLPPLEKTKNSACPPLPPLGTQVTVLGDNEPTVPKKRNRFSYSNKKFVANSSLFLKEGINFPDGGFNAIGKVMGCPSVKSGNMFQIQWEMNRLSHNIDSQWLRTELVPTTEVKQLLQRAITMYSLQCSNMTTDNGMEKIAMTMLTMVTRTDKTIMHNKQHS